MARVLMSGYVRILHKACSTIKTPQKTTAGRGVMVQARTAATAPSNTQGQPEGKKTAGNSWENLPVCSHTEWDTLEEIIVGRAEGHRIPELDPGLKVWL